MVKSWSFSQKEVNKLSMWTNMATVILKHFGTSIFMESFAKK
jgi:hypothetical protein